MRSLAQKILARFTTRAGFLRRRPRRGQTLVEYSLILALVGIVVIAVVSLLGKEIVVIFSAITTLLDSVQSSSF